LAIPKHAKPGYGWQSDNRNRRTHWSTNIWLISRISKNC